MRVRGAGGLLVGVVLYPVAVTFDGTAQGLDLGEALERLLWYTAGSPPTNTQFFIVVRDVLLVGGLLAGILGVAGLRASRVPIALASAGIALGLSPWVVYEFSPVTFDNAPPEWVFENPLWFVSSRWTALLWIVVCVGAFVLAVSDRAPEPVPARGPLGGTGPLWAAPPGPTAPGQPPPPGPAGPVPPVLRPTGPADAGSGPLGP
jgi:hypothetical protein